MFLHVDWVLDHILGVEKTREVDGDCVCGDAILGVDVWDFGI